MSHCKSDRTQEFQLEGRFLGFAAEAGGYKLKYLRLAVAAGEQQIKLAKELRSMLYRSLTVGEWVQVTGYQKLSQEKVIKLKAYQVTSLLSHAAIAEPLTPSLPSLHLNRLGAFPEVQQSSAAALGCILICQKSDCCKRGSRELAQALEAELSDRGLADQVKIKSTGCMKRCKQGANLVMPDKSRHTRVRPEEVAALVDQHFPETAIVEVKSA